MLAIVASQLGSPVHEAEDRDPGIVTLFALVVKGLRREARAAFARRCAVVREGGFNPAA